MRRTDSVNLGSNTTGGDVWRGCRDGVMTGRAVAISYDSWLSTKMSRTNVYQCCMQRGYGCAGWGVEGLGCVVGGGECGGGREKNHEKFNSAPCFSAGELSFRHIR